MKLFAQLMKVDEEKRLVFGRAAHETIDNSNEVMDYDGSKPHFQKWSEDVQKATNGQSLGNLRAMHGKVAAGKLVDIAFNDAEKAVDVVCKVVDDNEWKKVMEGVYTGFSIGGRYGDKTVEKADGKDITRYVAIPNELSLVDRPCIPTATFFEVQKADGSLSKVDFQPSAEKVYEVRGTEDDLISLQRSMVEKDMSIADVNDLLLKVTSPEKALEHAIAVMSAANKSDINKLAIADSADKFAALLKEFGPDEVEVRRVPPEGDKDEKIKPDGVKPPKGAKEGDADGDEGKDAAAGDDDGDEGKKAPPFGGKEDAKAEGGEDDDDEEDEEVAAEAEKLLKSNRGQSLMKAAIEKANAPLLAEINRLKSMPVPSRIVLRAVEKGDDLSPGAKKNDEQGAAADLPTGLVKDATGEVRAAATMIKALHASAPRPLGGSQ